ncbi:hypothetical protein PARHAE_04016 [Paracoccus haematequi]|uniref:Uncharacterized protein n=1 Tax=Paracoccus haematequi TaxID=2491866 RepID=A0A3S4D2B9_9RHOB|nr:hypothetical protein PARHAE_04016 [Paracoccus haematequi]
METGPTSIPLVCNDPSRNMARFYGLGIAPDLFGSVVLIPTSAARGAGIRRRQKRSASTRAAATQAVMVRLKAFHARLESRKHADASQDARLDPLQQRIADVRFDWPPTAVTNGPDLGPSSTDDGDCLGSRCGQQGGVERGQTRALPQGQFQVKRVIDRQAKPAGQIQDHRAGGCRVQNDPKPVYGVGDLLGRSRRNATAALIDDQDRCAPEETLPMLKQFIYYFSTRGCKMFITIRDSRDIPCAAR